MRSFRLIIETEDNEAKPTSRLDEIEKAYKSLIEEGLDIEVISISIEEIQPQS